MTLWTAIILGAVEGLTEFLPISSTGHLILVGPVTVAGALAVGGVVMLVIEHTVKTCQITAVEGVGLRAAWWVGVAQCFSLFPGVSRSAATIMGGLLVGMDRRTAPEFSFLLAFPTMIAATGYKIVKSHAL